MAEKKQIVCPKCKAKLKFDPEKFTSEVIKFKCPGCASILSIKNPASLKEQLPGAVAGKAESTFEERGAESQEPKSRAETDRAARIDPAASEKAEAETPAAQETLSEDNRVVCQNCKAKLKFDLNKITTAVVKARCPGCGSMVIIRKSGVPEEPSLPPTTASQSESGTAKPEIETPTDERKAGIEEDLSVVEQAEQAGEPVPPADSEKTEAEISAPGETIPRATQGPLIPEDRPEGPKEDGESVLEDFDHENLREYEEGEAEPGDLEWTRYAEKRPEQPEGQIDLDAIPATADVLQDTLADLQQAEMYNFQGENHLEKNRIPQAIRDFNNALEINPDYVEALVNRGSAFVLQNEFNSAIADFNHALELETKQAEIYNIRGEIYLLNRMFDEAIKDFTAAIILNPVYSDAYLNRAKAYNEKGMKEEADADFNQAIRADTDKLADYVDLADSESLFGDDSVPVREKIAGHMHQGLADLKNEDYQQAIENFSQVINMAADNAQAYINRAQAYIELGLNDEAMVDLNRAVIYEPLNPSLYYWRAKAWKAMNSPINMVSDLKLSCELGYQPAREEYEKCKPQKH
jgi:tetratricopeptide (TPR) repeat protein/predicted RNA-binding Zn-ribbon protein involved in translation (DUF1610 family)